jgi:NitT/TauT family transport system permease protein
MAAKTPLAIRIAMSLQRGWVRPLLFLCLVITLWDVSIRLFNVPSYQIPTPTAVLFALYTDAGPLLTQAIPTTIAAVAGFVLSAVFGILAAVLIAGSRNVENYVYPLLVFSQSIPKVAIAPLFVVWFGFGILPKILSAFLIGFFPVVVSAVQGFKSVEPEMLDLARAMEANKLQIFRMVRFPHAMPAIFAGLKVSVTLAVVGAVVGEFVGSNNGIGFLLQRSIGNFELPTMFAALVVLSMIGVALFWILDVLERMTIPWHASQRHQLIIPA